MIKVAACQKIFKNKIQQVKNEPNVTFKHLILVCGLVECIIIRMKTGSVRV